MLSRVPPGVLHGVMKMLKLPDERAVRDFSFSGGGCINNGGKITTSSDIFFLKWNDARKFPAMFEAESNGLKLLHRQNVIRIPAFVGHGENQGYQFLLLEFITQKSPSKNHWEDLGQGLARLHGCSTELFGLDHNNYIGSLPQYNAVNASWTDFFVEQRLGVQLTLAIKSGVAGDTWQKMFEALFHKLPSLG